MKKVNKLQEGYQEENRLILFEDIPYFIFIILSKYVDNINKFLLLLRQCNKKLNGIIFYVYKSIYWNKDDDQLSNITIFNKIRNFYEYPSWIKEFILDGNINIKSNNYKNKLDNIINSIKNIESFIKEIIKYKENPLSYNKNFLLNFRKTRFNDLENIKLILNEYFYLNSKIHDKDKYLILYKEYSFILDSLLFDYNNIFFIYERINRLNRIFSFLYLKKEKYINFTNLRCNTCQNKSLLLKESSSSNDIYLHFCVLCF